MGELPMVAKTSLCEIKFNRKDVKPMNKLMYATGDQNRLKAYMLPLEVTI